MRTKKKVTTIINAEELPEQMRKFAVATSKIKSIEAEIELQKQEIVRKYELKLQALNQQREEAVDTLQAYAEHHRDDLFVQRKSLELPHGLIGFRMGTPKVEKSKKVTWEGVIEDLRQINAEFVRVKEEANKDLIIAHRNDQDMMNKLGRIGLSVVQDETFFVEAKSEELVIE